MSELSQLLAEIQENAKKMKDILSKEVVSVKESIIVQGQSTHNDKWEDINPPYDEATNKRMPCKNIQDAGEIVLLYDGCWGRVGFKDMRIIKRKIIDTIC